MQLHTGKPVLGEAKFEMAKGTEYLITHYASDGGVLKQLRAPKSVSLPLLLKRLICQDLDGETLINSCLRRNNRRFHDPFRIIDMRPELRRESAQAALNANPDSDDPIGVYNRASDTQIPLGKIIMVAGLQKEYSVKEVEILL